MDTSAFQLLVVGTVPAAEWRDSDWGPFEVQAVPDLEQAAAALGQQHRDAILVGDGLADGLATWPGLSHAVLDSAVVVLARAIDPEQAARWLALGVQDVVDSGDDLRCAVRAVRLAIERKQLERASRRAYATDLATGLPHHGQLIEHMTHLLALREREPAPMGVLALRVDGLAATEAALGTEAANVLRRKIAVRLRAGLRASDVVASVGLDAYAVLLAWIDEAGDARHVADKLTHVLQQPFHVAGHDVAIALSIGVSLYPGHGRQADALLRHALGQAAGVVPVGVAAVARRVDRMAGSDAANDDEVPPA